MGTPTTQRQPALQPVRSRQETEAAVRHTPSGEPQRLQTMVGNRGMRQLLSGVRGFIGEGSPLPAAMRAEHEQRFGVDLGGVRLHDHAAAHQLAQGQLARAFTLGSDIVFNKGFYHPAALAGRRLIAHELAHVVQQGAGGARGGASGPAHEAAADAAATAVVGGAPGLVHAGPAAAAGIQCDPLSTQEIAKHYQEQLDSIHAELAELTPLVNGIAVDVHIHPADHALNAVRNLDARVRGDEKVVRDFEAAVGGLAGEVHGAVVQFQVMQRMLAPAVAAAIAWHDAHPAGESLGMMNERAGTWLAGAGSEQFDKGGLHYVPGALAYVGSFGVAVVDAAEKVASMGFHDAATAVSQAYTRGDISWNEGERIVHSTAWRALLIAAVTGGVGIATSRLGVMAAEATGLASTTLRYGAMASAIPGGLSAVASLGTQALLTKQLEDQFNSPAAQSIWGQGMPQGKDWAIAIPLSILMSSLGGMRGVEIANDKLVGSVIQTSTGPLKIVAITKLKLSVYNGKVRVTDPGVMVFQPVGGKLVTVQPPPLSELTRVFDPRTNSWVYPGAPPTGLVSAPQSRLAAPSNGGAMVRAQPTGGTPRLGQTATKALAGASGPALAAASKPVLPAGAQRQPLMLPPGEDFSDLGQELAQIPGSGIGTPMVWSVTPGGVAFATPPVPGLPLCVPEGPLPPSEFFAGPGQPRNWVMSGPLEPNFTPFDVMPGRSSTSRTLSQVRAATGPNARGTAGERHITDLSVGSQPQVTLDLPGGATRRTDVLSPTVAGVVNQEVKNYLRFRGSAGGARQVELTPFMQTEIDRDAMIFHYYGHQPVWVFTDAPPSQALRLALAQADIPYIVSSDRLP